MTIVEEISIAEDRKQLISKIFEFDPSDEYHSDDLVAPGYYQALDRVVALLRGEIDDWASPRPPRGQDQQS